MSNRAVIPVDTMQRQRRASSPAHSVWVSANAGSGKTEVLVQRVIRLLLDGARPNAILCLTFTKAAAAEMMNRVFKRLAEWISAHDHELVGEIEKITGQRPAAVTLHRARRLFADALETPGGLKVQTIHAFCERLLHLFPFDANVPAQFSVLDEAGQENLRKLALRALLDEFSIAKDDAAAVIDRIVSETTSDGLEDVLKQALSQKDIFLSYSKDNLKFNRLVHRLREAMSIPDDASIVGYTRDYFSHPFWLKTAPEFATQLLAMPLGSKNKTTYDHKTGAALKAILLGKMPDEQMASLRDYIYTSSGKIRSLSHVVTKTARQLYPESAVALDAVLEKFSDLEDKIALVETVERSAAITLFIIQFIARYQNLKTQRGSLDFDDLVTKTNRLLHRADIGPWILYKLDYGLSHILVDEAQDTSPEQWEIIKKLAEEFNVGDTANQQNRTIFAVGDEKQSIYSFQGAKPASFGETYHVLKRQHIAANRELANVLLVLSFRSTSEVLSAVDQTFSHGDQSRGLVFDQGNGIASHESLRHSEMGFVELWPQECGTDGDEISDPWNAGSADAADKKPVPELAERIARYIQHIITHGDAANNPVTAGDIMILVRHRGALFEAMIQALKSRNIPVAGADRLKLNAHIAIKDLLALGRTCLVPRDDLTLACVLKSPLFGLDDNDLMLFAPQRQGALDDALRDAAGQYGRLAAAWEKLCRWRLHAAQCGPFSFYTCILEVEGGRRAMMQRLGPEATDAINEFLQRTYAFEMRHSASLSAFLMEFESSDIEIKRDFAQSGDQVRVMTVHAAKGLEAPIVILPDTISTPTSKHKSQIVAVKGAAGERVPLWMPPGRREPPIVLNARADERLEQENEYRRQLYVAMTRARNGLLICGAQKRAAKPGSWYQMVKSALTAASHEEKAPGRLIDVEGFDGEAVQRWILPVEEKLPADEKQTAAKAVEPAAVPDWLFTPAPASQVSRALLTPSGQGEDEHKPMQPGDRDAILAARARGRLVHTLLEKLPALDAQSRRAAAHAIVQKLQRRVLPSDEPLISAVLDILSRPDLAMLFGPQSRAEVAITGRWTAPDGTVHDIFGIADRVAVMEDVAWVADFKTGPAPPRSAMDTPAGIVRQLALYQAAMRAIVAPRPVRCLVIWTDGPVVHELQQAQLDAALDALELI
ncbi:MAG: double-strand break repair helicase AddA [Beijerinckiaceae bacterium]